MIVCLTSRSFSRLTSSCGDEHAGLGLRDFFRSRAGDDQVFRRLGRFVHLRGGQRLRDVVLQLVFADGVALEERLRALQLELHVVVSGLGGGRLGLGFANFFRPSAVLQFVQFFWS